MNKEGLNTLNKGELINFIYEYWLDLDKRSEEHMKDRNYSMEEYGRVMKTEANRMNITVKHIIRMNSISQ